MDDFDRTKVSEKKKKLGKKLDGDDLSEDAIRGAVGGSDTVFSSSHAKPDTSGGMKRNETETESNQILTLKNKVQLQSRRKNQKMKLMTLELLLNPMP